MQRGSLVTSVADMEHAEAQRQYSRNRRYRIRDQNMVFTVVVCATLAGGITCLPTQVDRSDVLKLDNSLRWQKKPSSSRDMLGGDQKSISLTKRWAWLDLLENSEESIHLFEGDIVTRESTPVLKAAGVPLVDVQLWPNGIIPYVMSDRFYFFTKLIVKRAIGDFHRKTCVRFVRRTDETSFVAVIPGDGCSSSVGVQGGIQAVRLGGVCTARKGKVIHELMHAIGFKHEQSRGDRDNHVIIYPENAKNGTQRNFQKYNPNSLLDLDEPYDYGSVMHYGKYYFSRNRKPTIEPRVKGVKIGQRRYLSAIDIREINKLYNCTKYLVEDQE